MRLLKMNLPKRSTPSSSRRGSSAVRRSPHSKGTSLPIVRCGTREVWRTGPTRCIWRCGLYVIEDAAQAHGAEYQGARVGSLGDVACFSFYPGKSLGAFGDGGAITTNSGPIAERIERLSDHGRITKYCHAEVGFNSRL